MTATPDISDTRQLAVRASPDERRGKGRMDPRNVDGEGPADGEFTDCAALDREHGSCHCVMIDTGEKRCRTRLCGCRPTMKAH